MKHKEIVLSLIIFIISTIISLFTPMTIFATEYVPKILEMNGYKELETNLKAITEQESFVIENGVLVSYEGNAEKVDIPNDVMSIGVGVFSWCDNLKEVVIPSSVTSIESEAFLWCDNLKQITLSDSVTCIGDKVFADCVSLKKIIVPNGVTSIGDATFYGCSSLEEIMISDSVTSIGEWTFVYCTSLKEVIIPNTITTIGEYMFYGCSSLKQIAIPNSVKFIEEAAFYGCSSLEKIMISDSVTSIGELAFVDCTNLKEITIPENVIFIEKNAFDNVAENFVIYGYENSYAQQYAEENGITFEILKEDNELPVLSPTTNPFTDVPEHEYYYNPVLWALENGITTGLKENQFAPENSCTRGQVVTFLWRAKGCPEPTKAESPFKDVGSNEYYSKAVLWAVENGITTGLNATTFAPDETVTRAQFVTFLHRAEGKPTSNVENPFLDVKQDYYYDAVLWAVENGITTGLNAMTFGTEDPCTRGQVVTFLYRALNT